MITFKNRTSKTIKVSEAIVFEPYGTIEFPNPMKLPARDYLKLQHLYDQKQISGAVTTYTAPAPEPVTEQDIFGKRKLDL